MDGETSGLVIREGFVLPDSELHFSYTGASGPGGQHVNRTYTKVRLKWWPYQSSALRQALTPEELDRFFGRIRVTLQEDGSVQVTSGKTRSQEDNRQEAKRLLAERIRNWLKRPTKRVATKPTRASKRRRLDTKRRTGQIKRMRKRPEDWE